MKKSVTKLNKKDKFYGAVITVEQIVNGIISDFDIETDDDDMLVDDLTEDMVIKKLTKSFCQRYSELDYYDYGSNEREAQRELVNEFLKKHKFIKK